MTCIVVDDSKMARKAMTLLISRVSFLTLKKECECPMEAFNFLQTEDVDLVFLDIEMPLMSGIELIKNLEKRPIIIFVSSTKDYALEAFELNVADYLIKPVTIPRFVAAVDKAKEIYDSRDKKIESGEKGYIFVRSNSALTKINLDDILYIQALGDYINIHNTSKRLTVHCTLKNIEEKLPASKFFRLHRSYLIAVDQIDKVEENTAFIGKHIIPIGEQYKKDLLKRLNLI